MKTDSLKELLPTYLAIIVVIAAIGTAAWITDPQLNIFVFYFIPVALAGWRINAIHSYGVGLLCAVTWLLIDHHAGSVYTEPWIEFWNATIRFIAFIVIGHLIARIQTLLTAARKEVKTLSGLLPICAKCKKIRDDEGYWHHIECYIQDHAEVAFSHGICPQCAARLYPGFDPYVNKQQTAQQ